jgi:hypothetical protein
MGIQTVFFKEAPTRAICYEMDLPANGVRKIPAAPVPMHRKQIIITNEDNSDKLYVVEGNAVDPSTSTRRGATVFPNTSITLFTSDDIYLKAAGSGSVVSVEITEIFYLPFP